MKRILIIITVLIISSVSYSQKNSKFETGPSLDSIIDTCLASISSDSILNNLQTLENFGTRFCLANNHRDVAVWLQNKYISMGYANTVLDSFLLEKTYNSQFYSTYEYDVVATITGSETPEQVFIVGGHYDCYAAGDPFTIAPGADDNGTATVAALEIARVFAEKNIQPKSTIKFIAFAAEELGLYGGYHYANEAFASGEKIQMMINADMIGTNHEAPGSWHMTLQNYAGCENITALAKYICQNYTTLTPVDDNSNSSGSDSYTFWVNSYPTIFLQEYEFSSVYHTVNDLVINVDPVYCAEVTKVACGMLLQSTESPLQLKGLVVSDAGDGTSLSAVWQPSDASDFAGYRVHAGTAAGIYDTSYVATDTTFVISGLTEGTLYYIGVSAFDTDNNEGMAIEATGTPLSTPRIPENLEQLVSSTYIKLGWKKNQELDIFGYGIFRSDSPTGTFVPITIDVVEDTSYIDNSVSDHTFYYYKISAVDSAMNQSAQSDAIKARSITHDSGVLIVDDSEGGWLNPTDQQVDDFYNDLMYVFIHDNYDAHDSAKICLADMAAYSTLLWHIDRKIVKPVFFKYQNEIKKFLESGGNLLLTAYEPQGAVQNMNSYPYLYNPGEFIYDYLKIAYSNETDDALFIGAKPFATGYDSMYIDTLKVPTNNNHHVFGIESIDPNAEGSTILRYDSYFDIATPAGGMKLTSVGVEYIGADYKAITISFPLYFMNFNEAKTFTDFVMEQKFGEIMSINEQPDHEGALSFSIYPNPANEAMTLNIFSDIKANSSFKIFSVSGQLLKDVSFVCQQGLQQYQMDISALPAGFYVCTLGNGENTTVSKLVISGKY
jgi:hypothetical protein